MALMVDTCHPVKLYHDFINRLISSKIYTSCFLALNYGMVGGAKTLEIWIKTITAI